jgi:hypothetical protein
LAILGNNCKHSIDGAIDTTGTIILQMPLMSRTFSSKDYYASLAKRFSVSFMIATFIMIWHCGPRLTAAIGQAPAQRQWQYQVKLLFSYIIMIDLRVDNTD